MNHLEKSREQSPSVRCVTGEINPEGLGVCDAHNHVWIEQVPGAAPGLPRLSDFTIIEAELAEYKAAGGGSLVDCQPGRCGRNGHRLLSLSRASGVNVIACTGFHLPKYYAPDAWIYGATADAACTYFVAEIDRGLEETLEVDEPVRAGFIKIASQERLQDTPSALLDAAAGASMLTGAAIEIHTEKGSQAEKIMTFFMDRGIEPRRLVLCHIDKRPDFGLHRALAEVGILLEYDTFLRPKYEPEKHVWPLLRHMVEAGLQGHIALATDMAETSMWARLGGGHGLQGLVTLIRPRLVSMGMNGSIIADLLGGNIARRLALPH